MYHLGSFGGLVLRDEGGSPLPVQPRRLALLVLVAATGSRGITRDRLLATLWPESPPETARRALNQALYVLRQQLSEHLFLDGDPIRLNAERITDDRTRFEAALERGDPSGAIRVYAGPFLDGIHIDEADEFERWAEQERGHLASKWARAVERVAETAFTAGRFSEAEYHWRTLAGADPLSEVATAGVMRCLAALGDRAGALRAGQAFESRFREEVGTEPGARLHQLIEEIAASPGPALGPPTSVPSSSTPPQPQIPMEHQVPAPSARRWPNTWVAVGFLATAIAVVALVWQRVTSSPPTVEGEQIAVLPFGVLGDGGGSAGDMRWLGDGLAELLAAQMGGIGETRVVAPRAALAAWREATENPSRGESAVRGAMRLTEASLAVTGRIIVHPRERLEIHGELHQATGQRLRASAVVAGPADSLSVLVERLASQLLALHAGEGTARLSVLAGISYPALRSYLRARAAQRRGDVDSALGSFEQALALDSTFGLAALELIATTGWLSSRTVAFAGGRATAGTAIGPGGLWRPGYQDRWRQALALARRYATRLSNADRAFLTALAGRFPATTPVAERLADWERAAAAAPDRPEIRYALGMILLYQAPAIDVSEARARAKAEFRQALRLDRRFALPLFGLVEAAGLNGDTTGIREYATRYLSLVPDGESADYVRWHVAAATGDLRTLRTFRTRFDSLSDNVLGSILWTSQMEGIAPADADTASQLQILRAAGRTERRNAYFDRVLLALNRGRPAEAARLMEFKRAYDPYDHVALFQSVRFALYSDGDTAAAVSAVNTLSELLARTEPTDTVTWTDPRAYYRGLWFVEQWRVWHGDYRNAPGTLASLQTAADRWPAQTEGLDALPPFLDALVTALGAGPGALAAARRLDALGLEQSVGTFHNLVAARLLDRAGDPVAALRAARRGRWSLPPDGLSAYLREEARLAVATGDTAGAIRTYLHLLALSNHPEPRRLAEVEAIRRTLASLGAPIRR